MSPAPRPAIAAARVARHWLLWLALVLAAAHCVAIWHVYGHAQAQPAERASKSGHAGPADSCLVCLAAVGIGGAPTVPGGWHLTAVDQPGPAPLHDPGRAGWPAARPYAIRAPPPPAS